MQAMQRSAAASTLSEAFLPTEALTELTTTCELDPFTDLREVSVWVRGSDRAPFESFGLMLRGRLVDAAEIVACYRKLVEARGGTVVRLEASSGPMLASDDRRSAVAVLDSRSVVTGSVETVEEAMAVRRGLLPALGERAPIARLWREMSPGAAMVAAVHPPQHWAEALQRSTVFDAEHASVLQGVEALAFAVKPGPKRLVEVLLDTDAPEAAEQIVTLLRDWVEAPPQGIEPPWEGLLRSATVRAKGARARVTVDLASLATPHP
jgi:hypothetical protein